MLTETPEILELPATQNHAELLKWPLGLALVVGLLPALVMPYLWVVLVPGVGVWLGARRLIHNPSLSRQSDILDRRRFWLLSALWALLSLSLLIFAFAVYDSIQGMEILAFLTFVGATATHAAGVEHRAVARSFPS